MVFNKELIGSKVRLLKKGLTGKIIDETKNTKWEKEDFEKR